MSQYLLKGTALPNAEIIALPTTAGTATYRQPFFTLTSGDETKCKLTNRSDYQDIKQFSDSSLTFVAKADLWRKSEGGIASEIYWSTAMHVQFGYESESGDFALLESEGAATKKLVATINGNNYEQAISSLGEWLVLVIDFDNKLLRIYDLDSKLYIPEQIDFSAEDIAAMQWRQVITAINPPDGSSFTVGNDPLWLDYAEPEVATEVLVNGINMYGDHTPPVEGEIFQNFDTQGEFEYLYNSADYQHLFVFAIPNEVEAPQLVVAAPMVHKDWNTFTPENFVTVGDDSDIASAGMSVVQSDAVTRIGLSYMEATDQFVYTDAAHQQSKIWLCMFKGSAAANMTFGLCMNKIFKEQTHSHDGGVGVRLVAEANGDVSASAYANPPSLWLDFAEPYEAGEWYFFVVDGYTLKYQIIRARDGMVMVPETSYQGVVTGTTNLRFYAASHEDEHAEYLETPLGRSLPRPSQSAGDVSQVEFIFNPAEFVAPIPEVVANMASIERT